MKNLILLLALFFVGTIAKAQEIKIVTQTEDKVVVEFERESLPANVETATVKIYADQYIFDGTGIEECSKGLYNELVEYDGRLAIQLRNTHSLSADCIQINNVSGELLKYYKCFAEVDPVGTVEIE